MLNNFEMTDLGLMSFFLGMEIKQCPEGIFICQQKYCKEVLKKFNMENAKAQANPLTVGAKLGREDGSGRVDESQYRKLVGCLLYLTATRPDVMYAVSLLSRFMHCSSETHFKAAKRVLRYLKGTTNFGVMFGSNEKLKLEGYVDSDWAGSLDDMKSTTGYLFTFGSGGFSWSSRKQETIAQSTAEAEYIAASAAVNQAIWLKKLLIDLHHEPTEAIQIFCDNQAAVAIAKNPICHGKTKHFKIKFHFVREAQQANEVNLLHCSSENQLADIFTKALPLGRFESLRRQIGVCNYATKEEC